MFQWQSVFNKKKSHFQHLHEKWLDKNKSLQTNLWQKHHESLTWFLEKPKQAALHSLAGAMLLSQTLLPIQQSAAQDIPAEQVLTVSNSDHFISLMKEKLSKPVSPLTTHNAEHIAQLVSAYTHLPAVVRLEGKTINTNLGYIGQEQHLPQFPGDSIEKHFDTPEDTISYRNYGITTGLGAWGYVSDPVKEKYYIAVQTFLSPGYNEHVAEYNNFFKFRKTIVVNPDNGKAIIADIADAGPSPWTGKSFGGSPEVMNYLNRVDGAQRGTVLIFFLDDPKDTIPLGPVHIQ